MDDYPPIEDHGLIGDLQTAALVTKDGSIDWFCCPRFDSPSVFGGLLDSGRGGHFRVSPTTSDYTARQMYFPDSAILITRFMTEGGVGEVVDFMPVTGSQPTDHHRLVRMVRCVRGEMSFAIDISPRFDYGRLSHDTTVTENGATFRADGISLTMHALRDPSDEHLARFAQDGQDVRGSVTLRAGQVRGVVLETAAEGGPREVSVAEAEQLLSETGDFWRRWLAQSTYEGRWRESLQRSAITLKLMTYLPSGGIVAAPTAGLPEQVGGERNWDYRYTWVRDGSFSVYALLGMGFTEEAAAFCGWLRDRIEEKVGGEGGPLNIMYRVDGSSDLKEESLEHWEGYRGSSPVRIGNGAMDQVQMDIYGEAMDSIYFADQHGIEMDHSGWVALRVMLDWLVDHWDQPGAGIWEIRGGPQDFTYGRVMSWVAFDRALRLATSRGRPAATRHLGRAAGRDLRAGDDPRMEHRAAGVRAALQDRGAGLVAAPRGDGGLHLSSGPDVGLHVAGHGRRARDRQPGLPLRPLCGTRWSRGVRGHVLVVHVQLRRCACPRGPAARGAVDLREDAHLCQPPGPVCRGDRRDG